MFFKSSLLYFISYNTYILYLYYVSALFKVDIFTQEVHRNDQDRYDYCIVHKVTGLSSMYLAELFNYAWNSKYEDIHDIIRRIWLISDSDEHVILYCSWTKKTPHSIHYWQLSLYLSHSLSCGFESRLRQELSTTEVRLSVQVLQVCVHLDGLNAENTCICYVHKRPISLKYCSQICLNLC